MKKAKSHSLVVLRMSSESTDTLNSGQPNAAEQPAAVPPSGEPAVTAEALSASKNEAAENYNRYLRAVADLENFRRRTVREKDELRQYAASGVLEDLTTREPCAFGGGTVVVRHPNTSVYDANLKWRTFHVKE